MIFLRRKKALGALWFAASWTLSAAQNIQSHKLSLNAHERSLTLHGPALLNFLDEIDQFDLQDEGPPEYPLMGDVPTDRVDLSRRSKKKSNSNKFPPQTEFFDFVKDYFFFMNVSVGTPPQKFHLVIDTTSNDIVIPNSTFRSCVKKSEGQCELGSTFHCNESSTFKSLDIPYNFTRLNNVFLSGEYFEDNVVIGNLAMNNTQMALANDSSGATFGILGLGSTVAQGVPNTSDLYNGFMSILLEEHLIYQRVFSLWQQTNTTDNSTVGNLLIGGVDRSQYIDPLYVVPMVPMINRDQPYKFGFIALTRLSVSSQNVFQNLTGSAFQVPVLLDSSNAISYLPYAQTVAIATQLAAYYVDSLAGWIQRCDIRNLPGTINFHFYDATIKVPITNLLLDVYDDNGNPILFNNGNRVCVLALTSADTEGYSSLGVGVLAAAYSVFDFDDRQVAIAKLNPDGISMAPNITVLANNITDLAGVSVINPTQVEVSVGTPTSTVGLAEGNLLPYYVVPTSFENNGFTASLPTVGSLPANLFSQSLSSAPTANSTSNMFFKSTASFSALPGSIIVLVNVIFAVAVI